MTLEARGLRKEYATKRGVVVAVDDADLTIDAGEFVAVCGRSGSGKSTLLAMLGGLCRPTRGAVTFDGENPCDSKAGEPERWTRRFGYLFQFGGLLANLRAVDNVALPLMLRGSPVAQAYADAREMLTRVRLGDRWDAYPEELSGGQQRRVALARALIHRPKVLFADEPTNDLDEESQRDVFELLEVLHRHYRTTLVVATHEVELARKADRVITLRSGRIIHSHRHEPASVDSSIGAGAADKQGAVTAAFLPLETEETPALAPAEPAPMGEGAWSYFAGLAGWATLVAVVLWGANFTAASLQRMATTERQAERRRSEELAYQQLRAELEDVVYRPDGGYEATIAMQNLDQDKPFYVLGPTARIFYQVDRTWKPLQTSPVDSSERLVRPIGAGKVRFKLNFRADADRFDELLAGYLHCRVTSEMLVSEKSDEEQDVFGRRDDYYFYLRPQRTSEREIRQKNKWSDRALVPRWIAMPSH